MFNLIENDRLLRTTLLHHGVTRATLETIYTELCRAGADQFVGGHWVAASALINPLPLDFVLRVTGHGSATDVELWARVADAVERHFQTGELWRLSLLPQASYRPAKKTKAP